MYKNISQQGKPLKKLFQNITDPYNIIFFQLINWPSQWIINHTSNHFNVEISLKTIQNTASQTNRRRGHSVTSYD